MSDTDHSMSMFASTAEYWRHMAVRREAEIARLKEHAVVLANTERVVALERAATACDARYMGDNNREDMEARACAAAIRALK